MTSQQKSASSGLLNIDPNGDLVLDVSSPHAQRLVRVSSNALCLASPVFRVMLGPSSPFREGIALQANTGGGGPIQISLTGDDYSALLVVMNAIHLRTRSIPTTVTVDAFYQIAVVSDKYDLAEILVPWVKIWTDGYFDVAQKPGYERWLVISWVFRQSRIFSDVTRELILNTRLGEHCDLLTDGGYVVESEIIPDRVTRALQLERETFISSVVSLSVGEMKKYNSGALDGHFICQMKYCQKRLECDVLGIGTLFRCLFQAGIWPEQKGTEQRTAMSIIDALRYMKDFGKEIVETFTVRGNRANTHVNCGPGKRICCKVDDMLENLQGLQLLDFRPKDSIFFLDEE